MGPKAPRSCRRSASWCGPKLPYTTPSYEGWWRGEEFDSCRSEAPTGACRTYVPCELWTERGSQACCPPSERILEGGSVGASRRPGPRQGEVLQWSRCSVGQTLAMGTSNTIVAVFGATRAMASYTVCLRGVAVAQAEPPLSVLSGREAAHRCSEILLAEPGRAEREGRTAVDDVVVSPPPVLVIPLCLGTSKLVVD
eukprot:2619964-Rhodomonas_salina.2